MDKDFPGISAVHMLDAVIHRICFLCITGSCSELMCETHHCDEHRLVFM